MDVSGVHVGLNTFELLLDWRMLLFVTISSQMWGRGVIQMGNARKYVGELLQLDEALTMTQK